MNEDYKEVCFHKYCKTCKYEKLEEKFDPCNECLELGMNVQTRKPAKWIDKTIFGEYTDDKNKK